MVALSSPAEAPRRRRSGKKLRCWLWRPTLVVGALTGAAVFIPLVEKRSDGLQPAPSRSRSRQRKAACP